MAFRIITFISNYPSIASTAAYTRWAMVSMGSSAPSAMQGITRTFSSRSPKDRYFSRARSWMASCFSYSSF